MSGKKTSQGEWWALLIIVSIAMIWIALQAEKGR